LLDEEGVRDLYDYEAKDLINQPLSILIPSVSTIDDVKTERFFGSCTKRGAQFPIIARQEEEGNTVRIISMPVIAGLMTIKKNGIIEGCNDIFVKYLFGFSQQDLVLKKNISEILPQFSILFKNLTRDDLLQPGLIINNIICRKLLQDNQKEDMLFKKQKDKRALTHTPNNNQPLPILLGMHRDGTLFEVQLQLKLCESSKEEFALWISFDREVAFKRYGHHHLISLPPPPPPPPIVKKEQKSPIVIPPSTKKRSPIKEISCDTSNKNDITYSTSTTIHDYDVLDNLGQGAYGLVKLAIKKNDPLQVKIMKFPFIVYHYFKKINLYRQKL
jgi:hypothetical protein